MTASTRSRIVSLLMVSAVAFLPLSLGSMMVSSTAQAQTLSADDTHPEWGANPARCYPLWSFEGQLLKSSGSHWVTKGYGGSVYICSPCVQAGSRWACVDSAPIDWAER